MQKEFFQAQRQAALTQARILKQKDSRLVLGRGAAFLALVFALAAGWDGHALGWVLAALLLAGFCLLVRAHARVRHTLLLTESRLAVLADWLSRFDDGWKELAASGESYRRAEKPQAEDLNLYGHASAFQYLCQARTRMGRDQLASALSPVPPARAVILARQQAAAELGRQGAQVLAVQTCAALLPENHDTQPLLQSLRQEFPAISPLWEKLALLLPVCLLVSCLLAAGGYISWLLPGLLVLWQFTLTQLFDHRHEDVLAPLSALQDTLQPYAAIFEQLEKTTPQAPLLQELQARLRPHEGHPGATASLRMLARLTSAVSARRNFAFLILANAALLWDVHCCTRTLRWRQAARHDLADWLVAFARWEMLASLSTPFFTRQHTCLPELLPDGRPQVQGWGVISLLLPEAQAVPNDMDFAAGTCIITGSNMSGKTTYLRTLALSAILAYAGAPVCAARFALTPMPVYTSMRIADDLEHGISTFYAELLRIKAMIAASRKGTAVLLCIDEIFKGTNSADRIVGARAAITQLSRPHCLTLVTTHDFELCDLQTPDGRPVRNLHFTEHYEGDKIAFDFKVRPGRCQTTNARYLLRMAGILPAAATKPPA